MDKLVEYWNEIKGVGKVPIVNINTASPIHYGITKPLISSQRNIDTREGKADLFPTIVLISNEGLYTKLEGQTDWERHPGSVADLNFNETVDTTGKATAIIKEKVITYSYQKDYSLKRERELIEKLDKGLGITPGSEIDTPGGVDEWGRLREELIELQNHILKYGYTTRDNKLS